MDDMSAPVVAAAAAAAAGLPSLDGLVPGVDGGLPRADHGQEEKQLATDALPEGPPPGPPPTIPAITPAIDVLPQQAEANTAPPAENPLPQIDAPPPPPPMDAGAAAAESEMPPGLSKMQEMAWRRENDLGPKNDEGNAVSPAGHPSTPDAPAPAPAPAAGEETGVGEASAMPEGLSKMEQMKVSCRT